MQTKEQLLFHILVKHFRLHYSDRKFFTNLSILVKNSKITTGQAALFDKLIGKYYNQLKNTNLTLEEMLSLQWKVEVIETSSDYTSARVKLENNFIILKVPTNKNFINKLESSPDCTYEWEKQSQEYRSPFNTKSLRLIYNMLPIYFKEVRYCDTLQRLIKDANQIGTDLVWSPTLVKINNTYFVAAANNRLYELIKDINLNDEPKTLYRLSQLGISTDKKITNNDPFLEFASKFAVDIEISDLDLLIVWLKELGVSQVLLGKGVHTVFEKTRSFFKEFIKKLDEESVSYRTIHTGYSSEPNQTELPILLQYHGNEMAKFCGKNALGKCIFVKNSTPIEVQ
jgi:hypothetical protein